MANEPTSPNADYPLNDKGQWVVPRTCSQCGETWFPSGRACGPTHAVIAGEIRAGLTVTEA